MFSLAFWRALVERATKTASQAALLAVGADSLGANAFTVDWLNVLGFALGGFALSALTSIGSDALTGGGPSLTNAEVVEP